MQTKNYLEKERGSLTTSDISIIVPVSIADISTYSHSIITVIKERLIDHFVNYSGCYIM